MPRRQSRDTSTGRIDNGLRPVMIPAPYTGVKMGLTLEILGLIIFLGAHVFVPLRDRRAALISSIGRGPYLGLFSVTSIVGLLLLGYGFARYRAEGIIPLWYPPAWT